MLAREHEKQSSTKIVAVDDDDKNLWMLTEILGHHQLKTFKSAQEALKQIPLIKPDIVILDFFMPDGNGGEICQILRENPDLKLTKFFIISGHGEIKNKMVGYKHGADDYIVKPYDSKELNAKVNVYERLIKLEKQLWDLNQNLEKKVEVTARELQKAEKLSYIGLHTAEIVHNLKSPIAILKIISSQLLKATDADVAGKGQKLMSALGRIETFVTGILNNGEDSATIAIDPGPSIRGEIDILKLDSWVSKEVEFKYDFDLTSPIFWRRQDFSQVVENLLQNACHAVHESETPIIRISVKEDKTNSRILVSIEDNGYGISDENLQKIWQPFFTTKKDSDKGPVGTGLGLSYVKRILEIYGGDIFIKSQVGLGTNITLSLKPMKT